MNLNFISFGLKCIKNLQRISGTAKIVTYYFSTTQNISSAKIRNIGILAQIGAGKTVTTEKMFLISDQHEKENSERRGYCPAAAVTFYWKKIQFNVINTQSCIDLTKEAEQMLEVVDGAIVLLDGSKIFDGQTLAIWRQADRYQIPRIIFVNKMDKFDANILAVCDMIKQRLQIPYLLLQLPVIEKEQFIGVIDILTMELLTKEDNARCLLSEKKHQKLFQDAKIARSILVDKLTIFDETLADRVIHLGSLDLIPTDDIVNSLRKVTKNQSAVPVLLGSSDGSNFGIHSLLDAAVMYLPSPNERNYLFNAFEDNLCARVFKVTHDKQKGLLAFLRIYSGNLHKRQQIYSIKQKCTEQIEKLYRICASDDVKEVEAVTSGNVAIIGGATKLFLGELVTNSVRVYQNAKNNILKNDTKAEMEEGNIDKILGVGVDDFEPVFFRIIEPTSITNRVSLDQALTEMQREDPTLKVTQNTQTGTITIAGISELHLDIIRDRIVKEYRLEIGLGPVQIAFKEGLIKKSTDTLTVEKEVGTGKHSVTVKVTVEPTETSTPDSDILVLDKSTEYANNIANIFPKHLMAVRQGIETGLTQGPKIGCPVISTRVILHYLLVGKGTSEEMISSTVTQLVKKILEESGTFILEPVMNLEIFTSDEYLSAILIDLATRNTIVSSVALKANSKVITSRVQLSNFKGYSDVLNTLSNSTATFTMTLHEYEKMSPELECLAVKNVKG